MDEQAKNAGRGGYETEGQAREAAAELIERSRETWELGASPREVRVDYLASALRAAGVELGAFDETIVGWLAGWEPETIQTVVRWIESAAAGAAVR